MKLAIPGQTMDCGAVSSLTVPDAITCVGQVLSPLGSKLANLTLGQILQTVVSIGIAPALMGSVGLPFVLIGKLFNLLTRRRTYQPHKQSDEARDVFTKWYLLSGFAAFVTGLWAENDYLIYPGAWLLVCSGFFMASGRTVWGDEVDKNGERVYR